MPALLLAAAVLGALRVEYLSTQDASSLATYHGRGAVLVRGVVSSDPEAAGAATRFRFSVRQVGESGLWREKTGDVLVTLRESAEVVLQRDRPYFRYGDRLLLEGFLEPPPVLGDFDYAAFLARQGIDSVMSFPKASLLGEGEGEGVSFYRWLYGVRQSVGVALADTVPEPQASVGQAVLLGLRDNLPEDLVEDFRATGTSHLLAISGLHVGTLLGLSLAASWRVLGRRRQHYLIAPLLLMWLYALIAGMSPSVTRAAIMGSVYLAALALGRPRSVLPALGLAAAVMVAVSPHVMWSVSFQLSFAAMAGIAVVAEPLRGKFRRLLGDRPEKGTAHNSLRDFVADAVAMTVAASFATLPLVAFYFERVSLVGLPATLLSLPALPMVLVTQAAAGAVGLVSTDLAQPLGWLAWLFTSYLTGVVGLFARAPAASIETGPVAPLLAWAYYVPFLLWYTGGPLLSAAPRALARLRGSPALLAFRGRAVPWWVLFGAVSVAALAWIAALSVPDGRLHVTFADVGQGDAVFIVTPSGANIVVDGGPDPLDAARVAGSKLRFWDRTIDLVVLTHPHSDHVSGLTALLRRYDVERVLERRVEYDSPAYQAWRQAVDGEGATVTQAWAGQVVTLDDGVLLQVVGPPEKLMRGTSSDVDNASVVLRRVYGRISFLLTGDIFGEAEADLVARNALIDSDVLKVAHHGSRTSSIDEFLDAVTPAPVVVSVGEDNRFGHPHPQTVTALLGRVPEDSVYLTSEKGDIEFVTDGTRLEVNTRR